MCFNKWLVVGVNAFAGGSATVDRSRWSFRCVNVVSPDSAENAMTHPWAYDGGRRTRGGK
jgi:hypothetical protein